MLRCSARITILLLLSAALLPLLAQDQQKRESPPAPTGPARGAMVHFVLDRTLKTRVQPIRRLAFGGDHPTLAGAACLPQRRVGANVPFQAVILSAAKDLALRIFMAIRDSLSPAGSSE